MFGVINQFNQRFNGSGRPGFGHQFGFGLVGVLGFADQHDDRIEIFNGDG